MRRSWMPFLLLLALNAWAGDVIPVLQTVNGGGTAVVLRDVRIIKVEPDGVRVLHSAGAAKLPFERLPKDLQAKYASEAAASRQQETPKAPASAARGAPVAAPSPAAGASVTAVQTVKAPAKSKEDIKKAQEKTQEEYLRQANARASSLIPSWLAPARFVGSEP